MNNTYIDQPIKKSKNIKKLKKNKTRKYKNQSKSYSRSSSTNVEISKLKAKKRSQSITKVYRIRKNDIDIRVPVIIRSTGEVFLKNKLDDIIYLVNFSSYTDCLNKPFNNKNIIIKWFYGNTDFETLKYLISKGDRVLLIVQGYKDNIITADFKEIFSNCFKVILTNRVLDEQKMQTIKNFIHASTHFFYDKN